jgi:hypothetical protein
VYDKRHAVMASILLRLLVGAEIDRAMTACRAIYCHACIDHLPAVRHKPICPPSKFPGGGNLGLSMAALRHQAWIAASQSRGPVSLPRDAAVQQQPQAVVGEVTEAVPDPRTSLAAALLKRG